MNFNIIISTLINLSFFFSTFLSLILSFFFHNKIKKLYLCYLKLFLQFIVSLFKLSNEKYTNLFYIQINSILYLTYMFSII